MTSSADRTRRRLGYGWWVVAALAITETTSFGVIFYGFGIFLKPMEADLGLSRSEMAGAFSVAVVCQGVASVVVGRWLDRHSPRALMTVGSILAVVGVLWWSRVNSMLELYLVWAFLGVVMAAILYDPAFTVIAKWFRGEERRRALTAVTLVAGFASTIFLPLEDALIEAQGWRQAMVTLAIILGVITIPLHAFVLKAAPTDLDDHEPAVVSRPGAGLGDLIRSSAFVNLAAALVLFSFAMTALAIHQVAYLVELGYTPAFAALATGVLGAMQVPGRLLFGPLHRVMSRRAVTSVVYGTVALGLAVLAIGQGVAMVWTFIVVYGMGRGMATLLRATLVADLFGSRLYGSVTGVLALLSTLAQAAAPLAAGALYDMAGSYGPVVWSLVAIAAVGAVAANRIERPPASTQASVTS